MGHFAVLFTTVCNVGQTTTLDQTKFSNLSFVSMDIFNTCQSEDVNQVQALVTSETNFSNFKDQHVNNLTLHMDQLTTEYSTSIISGRRAES